MTRSWISIGAVLLLSLSGLTQEANRSSTAQPACNAKLPSIDALVSRVVPKQAKLNQELRVDLNNDGVYEVALVYLTGARSEHDWATGTLEVWRCEGSSWRLIHKNAQAAMGPHDQLRIEKVKSKGGREALVVISHYEGAGTSTSWELLAEIRGKVNLLPTERHIQRALARKGRIFNGYNSVTTDGDLIVNEIPGYSPHTTRCCPDLPPVRITFRFTGTELHLDSIQTAVTQPKPGDDSPQ